MLLAKPRITSHALLANLGEELVKSCPGGNALRYVVANGGGRTGQLQVRVLLWGTYDLGKPRVRLMRDCLRQIDPDLIEVHHPVWNGVEDKSGLTGSRRLLAIAMNWLLAYPVLLWRFLWAPRADVVVVGYLGLLDVIIHAPFARMRGIPVVWDAFLSLYDTYVRDRAIARSDSLRARLLFRLELLASCLARVVVLDTRAHADLFAQLYKVPADRLAAVFVGAEEAAFGLPAPRLAPANARPLALFYGQFIPLHGIDTIVEAALSVRGKAFDWQIVGQGQEAPRIDALLAVEGRAADHVERIDWVDYARLQGCMAQADVCLGIFGTSDKASRVIPNKVFQAIVAGMPLITRDSPAMRELAPDDLPGLYLVEAGDPAALLDALEAFVAERDRLPTMLHAQLRSRFRADALAQGWRNTLELAIAGRHSGSGSVAA